MKPAVIYARYSSDRQRAESIEQQVDVCSDFAEREGYTVTHIYTDKAISGRTDRREGFLKMVEDARSKNFEAVIVYKLDRFARNRYDAAMYRHKLKECGVRVVSAMEAIPDTPEGRLMEGMIEGVAEWYSADLSQKITRGMRSNAEKCLSNGLRIYGYTITDNGTYAVDEEQAANVVRAFELWNAGHSAASIATELASRGVITRVKKRPQGWWVRRLIADERYTGVYIWDDIRVPDGIPAIVEREVWEKAQRRRRPSRATTRRHSYPLVGRLTDAETGLAMCGVCARGRNGREYTYYAVKKDGEVKHRVPCYAIEDAVVAAVSEIFADASAVEDVVSQVVKTTQAKDIDNEYVEALRRLEELKAEDERLIDAVMAGVELDGLKERISKHNGELALARERVERARPVADLDPDVLRDVLMDLQAYASPDEIMANLVSEVAVYRCEGIVVVRLPLTKKGTTEYYENRRSEMLFSSGKWWSTCELGENSRPIVHFDGADLLIVRRLAA